MGGKSRGVVLSYSVAVLTSLSDKSFLLSLSFFLFFLDRAHFLSFALSYEETRIKRKWQAMLLILCTPISHFVNV